MAGLPGKLQHQAVGETEGRPGAEEIKRRSHGVGILQCQVLVIQQHFDGSGQAGGVQFVYGCQDPGGFGKREYRYPSPLLDESVGSCGLPGIVARDQSNQNIGINGAHDAPGRSAGYPLSCRRQCAISEVGRGTTPDGCPGK
jgi:hypothetical protein